MFLLFVFCDRMVFVLLFMIVVMFFLCGRVMFCWMIIWLFIWNLVFLIGCFLGFSMFWSCVLRQVVFYLGVLCWFLCIGISSFVCCMFICFIVFRQVFLISENVVGLLLVIGRWRILFVKLELGEVNCFCCSFCIRVRIVFWL